ncbi:NADH dehydrogenase [ubiquinone] 1 alpha subcomplex assembly factor 8 isoform 1-T2 [Callospermophilus lateralis]|uniref:NADH dehydrogenase [ubiquinone] 1 alpha subcomplex assembly factor 8 isoform X1 n=1 Tax=Callospermophilus lateralis TaxID=76772 RepID=UPI004053DC2C
MSANGAVWGRVRSRLRAFPERLAACAAEAAAYGRCVQASTAPGGRLSKDVCAREFEALRSCFAAARRDLAKLLRLALDSQSSCFSLLSNWDYRPREP